MAFAAIAPNGDIVGKKTFYCFGQQANANEWKSIGKAEYSEDVLASIYPNDVDNVKYEVDIEESVSTPDVIASQISMAPLIPTIRIW